MCQLDNTYASELFPHMLITSKYKNKMLCILNAPFTCNTQIPSTSPNAWQEFKKTNLPHSSLSSHNNNNNDMMNASIYHHNYHHHHAHCDLFCGDRLLQADEESLIKCFLPLINVITILLFINA